MDQRNGGRHRTVNCSPLQASEYVEISQNMTGVVSMCHVILIVKAKGLC